MTRDGSGMSATVELIEPTGFGIILHLSLHGLPFKIFTLDRDALKAGPSVNVAFPAQYLHVFDGEGNRVELEWSLPHRLKSTSQLCRTLAGADDDRASPPAARVHDHSMDGCFRRGIMRII